MIRRGRRLGESMLIFCLPISLVPDVDGTQLANLLPYPIKSSSDATLSHESVPSDCRRSSVGGGCRTGTHVAMESGPLGWHLHGQGPIIRKMSRGSLEFDMAWSLAVGAEQIYAMSYSKCGAFFCLEEGVFVITFKWLMSQMAVP